MKITGKALKFADNVNTDILHPSCYFSLKHETIKSGLFKGTDSFSPKRAEMDNEDIIVVAGNNFGCGSSRETTILAFKLNGVKAVVAESFSRIFYRSLINAGIPALECQSIKDRIENNDFLEMDINRGILKNLSSGQMIGLKPLDFHIIRILASGNLINFLKDELKTDGL